jgi:hypothetical protein
MAGATMIVRRVHAVVVDHLDQFPAVALVGPRQVGKTTLARAIAEARDAVYLDLEVPGDREKLADPVAYLAAMQDRLVVIDEVQHAPGLFAVLRGLIDARRRAGRRAGHFLLLGSASMALLRQAGESLAGRIAHVEMRPIDALEVEPQDTENLWLRGGFPDSLLASSDQRSLRWRTNFIRSYLERDIPALAPRIAPASLLRLWTMLANGQGTLLNAAHLARALAVDGKTVARYLDLLEGLLLVRRLPPYHRNIGKRLVRSPKLYVRDAGIVHALLGIASRDALYGHPVVGASWEGMVIETLLAAAPDQAQAYFYRTSAGAEVDLLIEMPGGQLWGIEIKRGLVARVDRGFHQAAADLSIARRFVVHGGAERHPKGDGIDAIGLQDMASLLLAAAPA